MKREEKKQGKTKQTHRKGRQNIQTDCRDKT
jgi:hypothetical protein